MSANNFILVEEKEKKGKRYFRISDRDMESEAMYTTHQIQDLRKAIEIASEMAEESEYGIYFRLLEERKG